MSVLHTAVGGEDFNIVRFGEATVTDGLPYVTTVKITSTASEIRREGRKTHVFNSRYIHPFPGQEVL
jgi:hypothetical protein